MVDNVKIYSENSFARQTASVSVVKRIRSAVSDCVRGQGNAIGRVRPFVSVLDVIV